MKNFDILPDFVLTSRQNQTWQTSGMDRYEECLDKVILNHTPIR